MKIAITGLSNAGKTTVFNALTGLNIETTAYPTLTGEPSLGTVKVPDHRIDRLKEIFRPKKTTYATVNYIDYIGLTKGDKVQNSKVFEHIKDADTVVHVVRAFSDSAVSHPMNHLDPLADFEILELELILGDLEFIERRLQRIQDSEKKGKKANPEERALLLRCKSALEQERPLRSIDFNETENAIMRPMQFLSDKPEIVVINISEEDLNTPRQAELEEAIKEVAQNKGIGHQLQVLSLCGKLEMEIAQLGAEEADAFLQDMGIREPVRERLIKVSYGMLGLISFLTYGEDEVRAWTIRRGDNAQKAAGKIHSDIERGFIRAEVIAFEDFLSCGGSMVKAKEKGLVRLEGKTYEVRDGDMIHFRFNV